MYMTAEDCHLDRPQSSDAGHVAEFCSIASGRLYVRSVRVMGGSARRRFRTAWVRLDRHSGRPDLGMTRTACHCFPIR